MKDDKVFIGHILDEVSFLIERSRGLKFEDFEKDETLKRAFARSLEIIGEATKNISPDYRERHQEIEWKELTGLRDKLIHHYFGLSWERVWNVITDFVPKLKEPMETLLREDKGG